MAMTEKTRTKMFLILMIVCFVLGAAFVVYGIIDLNFAPYDQLHYVRVVLGAGFFLLALSIYCSIMYFYRVLKGRRLNAGIDDLAILTDATIIITQLLLHYKYTDKNGITRTNIINAPTAPQDIAAVKRMKNIPIKHNGRLSALRETEFIDMLQKEKAKPAELVKIARIDLNNHAACSYCGANIIFADKVTAACDFCLTVFIRPIE